MVVSESILGIYLGSINVLGDSICAGIVDYLSKDDLQAMEDEESKTDVLDEPKQNGGNYLQIFFHHISLNHYISRSVMCVSVNVHTCTIVHVGEFNTPTVTSAATPGILPPLQDVRTLYNCLKLPLNFQ